MASYITRQIRIFGRCKIKTPWYSATVLYGITDMKATRKAGVVKIPGT